MRNFSAGLVVRNFVFSLIGVTVAAIIILGYQPGRGGKKPLPASWSWARGWHDLLALLGGSKSALVLALIAAALVGVGWAATALADSPSVDNRYVGLFVSLATLVAALVGLKWVHIEGPAVWVVLGALAVTVVLAVLTAMPMTPSQPRAPRPRQHP